MPQFPLAYLRDLPSCSALSESEAQYALSVAFALPMITIIPLPSGRIAVLTGHGAKVLEFSCEANELGPALSRVLYVRVDKPRVIPYSVSIEAIPDLDISL